MELLYIWVENYYDKFINQGFNISTEYNITYKEGSLNIRKNTITFSLFSNTITCCKAIVGENGVGKTTLINLMSEIFDYNNESFQVIVIFKIDEKIKIYSRLEKNKIKFSENSERVEFIEKEEYQSLLQSLGGIKYSPAFHTQYSELLWTDNKNYFDISTDYYLREIYRKNRNKVDKPLYTLLNYEDLIKIKDFAFQNELKLETTRFIKPTKLKFDVITNVREYISKSPQHRNEYKGILEELQIDDKRNKIAILSFATAIIFKDYENKKPEKLDEYFARMIEIVNGDKIETEEIAQIAKTLELISNQALDTSEIHTFLKILNDLDFKVYIDPFTKKEKSFNDYFMTAYLDKKDNLIIDNILELNKNITIQQMTQISWCNGFKFSTGQEYALLMYSRFQYLFKEKFKEGDLKFKNLLILLDEPDIYFHPNWKRHFLNDFMIFMNELVNKFRLKYNVQLIIASNEPYIISDLPKENIIFLKNENGQCKVCDNDDFKQTFGSNIHTLLTDSFFMDNTIGEFANQKIKEVARDLSEKSKEEILQTVGRKEEIEYIIKNIGEPVIKRKLEQMYKTTFLENREDYELEIAKLQTEKARLVDFLKDKGLDKIENVMDLLDMKIRELKEKSGDGI